MILVTGANGFVGKALIQRFVTEGQVVRATVRTPAAASALRAEHPQVEVVAIGDIGPATVWDEAVRSADAVVHLASRVHVMRETEPDPLRAFRGVNTGGSIALASELDGGRLMRGIAGFWRVKGTLNGFRGRGLRAVCAAINSLLDALTFHIRRAKNPRLT